MNNLAFIVSLGLAGIDPVGMMLLSLCRPLVYPRQKLIFTGAWFSLVQPF